MHRLDNALGEFEAGIDAMESGNEFEFQETQGEEEYGELAGEYAGEYGQGEWSGEYGEFGEQETVFDEVQEMELAAELLEINSEEELEQFLGKLIKSAGKAIGGFVKSPIGKALGGALKGVAKVALPMAGKVLGNMVLPGVGGMIGGKLASAAGGMFGLELEGMSRQDQEFEVARRVVRLAGESVKHAAQMPPVGPPTTIAKNAVLAAAARHAPGLAGRAAAKPGGCVCRQRPHGGGQGYRPQRPQRVRPPRPGYGAPSGPGYAPAPGYASPPAYDGGSGNGGGYAPAGNGSGGGYGPPAYGPQQGPPQGPSRGFARSGSWFRRGNTVVLTPGN